MPTLRICLATASRRQGSAVHLYRTVPCSSVTSHYSDTSYKEQDNYNHQDKAETSTRVIPLAGTIRPSGQRTNSKYNQYNKKNSPHRYCLLYGICCQFSVLKTMGSASGIWSSTGPLILSSLTKAPTSIPGTCSSILTLS